MRFAQWKGYDESRDKRIVEWESAATLADQEQWAITRKEHATTTKTGKKWCGGLYTFRMALPKRKASVARRTIKREELMHCIDARHCEGAVEP